MGRHEPQSPESRYKRIRTLVIILDRKKYNKYSFALIFNLYKAQESRELEGCRVRDTVYGDK